MKYLDTDNTDLLVELKSTQARYFSLNYIHGKNYRLLLESVKGDPYWMGSEE
jgi:hypothetical protein